MRLTETYKAALPADVQKRYEMREVRSAAAVLAHTSPDEFAELVQILSDFALTKADIVNPGKNEGQVAKRLNHAFREQGWREGRHDTKVISILKLMPYRPAGEKKAVTEESEVISEGYKVDNVKGSVALDVEWSGMPRTAIWTATWGSTAPCTRPTSSGLGSSSRARWRISATSVTSWDESASWRPQPPPT